MIYVAKNDWMSNTLVIDNFPLEYAKQDKSIKFQLTQASENKHSSKSSEWSREACSFPHLVFQNVTLPVHI